MTPDSHDRSIFELIDQRAIGLEDELQSDVVSYHGPIHPALFSTFLDFIEDVKRKSLRKDNNTISVVLRTNGGSAETTERMVGVLRKHYDIVNFVVPDMAMSAGTIFCMSGDRIYMDYASSLGPIDPQVLSDTGDWVPALGYIDKIAEIVKKPEPSLADIMMLKSIDLGKLAFFEQARELSIELLKKWLVEYKFKDWNEHRTTNPGTSVTLEEKIQRAKDIATDLLDYKKWCSHGRHLNIEKLESLGIEIDDYSNNDDLRTKIKGYNDPLTGVIDRKSLKFYLHNSQVDN